MKEIKFDKAATRCDACVVTCMDFRLYKDYSLDDFLKTLGVNTYDLIAVPGAGKTLIDTNSREMVLNGIKLSLELHNAQTIYLLHHKDCGAYGGSKSFETPDAELENHTKELKNAKQIIQEELGSYIPIKMIFLDAVADISDMKTFNIKAISVI